MTCTTIGRVKVPVELATFTKWRPIASVVARCTLASVPREGSGTSNDAGGLVGDWPRWWFPTLALLSGALAALLATLSVVHFVRSPESDASPWWVYVILAGIFAGLSIYCVSRSLGERRLDR